MVRKPSTGKIISMVDGGSGDKTSLFTAVSQLTVFTADCLRHPIRMARVETIRELHTLIVLNSCFLLMTDATNYPGWVGRHSP